MRNLTLTFQKIGTLLTITSLLLAGCSSATSVQKQDNLFVVATTTIVGDVVHQIAGDLITLDVLLPTGADPHAFEPRPVHITKIAEADLIFANGAGLETFLDPLIQNAGGDAKLVEVSEGISFLQLDANHYEEAENDDHGNADPHVWHDPLNVMVWVENITRALSEADPEHADDYQKNAINYNDRLQQLDERIQEIVGQIPVENRQLVTDHLIFGYFAQRYGFKVVESIIPGFSTLSSPSAQELAALQDQISQENVRAIFVGVSINPSLAEQIARDAGIKLVFVYTGALSEKGQPGATYLEMMEYNAQAIADALK